MLQMQGMARIEISSRDNARLRSARKVRDGSMPGLMFVEGVRLVEEALRSPVDIDVCFVRRDVGSAKREAGILAEIESRGVEVFEMDERIFSSVAETRSPQGMILICRRPSADRETFRDRIESAGTTTAPIVVLHEVNNSSNLGAVLRTSEAAGVKGVIVTERSADALSPAALRASMGSAFRLPVWTGAAVPELIQFVRREGLTLTAVTASTGKAYFDIDWQLPRALIFGSEAHGIPGDVLAETDEAVSIPMSRNVESLNLAVAAGVVLFEARRPAG